LQGIAQLGIGGVSLITGIISTIANFLEYAQKMEAHRGASISWGKLHRKIAVELSLPRAQREPCMEFLIVSRSELDRLIEQSPAVPDGIITEFKKEFPDSELAKPTRWNDMEKTTVYVPKDEKMSTVISRAAHALRGEKRLIKEVATPEVKNEIVEEVLKRQISTPRATLRQTVRSDLEALKSSGIVSQFFNKTAKVITPLRSERESEPEDFKSAEEFKEATNVDVVVTIDVPEASAPSDTCPESEDSRERASNV